MLSQAHDICSGIVLDSLIIIKINVLPRSKVSKCKKVHSLVLVFPLDEIQSLMRVSQHTSDQTVLPKLH